MFDIDLDKIKKIHFVGIGGIGVSAIARMMLAEDKEVIGSDCSKSLITDELEKIGAKIFYEHAVENVPNDTDLVVYSPAIKEDNPEVKKAEELGILILSYPQILGIISEGKFTIAVSGSHGKTTTTAMIGKIMIDANLSPTIIAGSLLNIEKNGNRSNFISGKSDYFVVEACEYKKSFLNITHPNIIVITNIDSDHLDYYGSLENVKKAFAEFAAMLGENDFLICDPNDENLKNIAEGIKANILDYTKEATAGLKLKMPGEHNVRNAKAAMAVANVLKVGKKKAIESLNDFSGAWRRFEHKGETKNEILIYDDYGHHPAEIKATLKGAKEFFNGRKIFCIFQPHLYSRTKLLFEDFGKSFADADNVILMDIYAARENDDGSVNSKMLVGEINKNGYKATYLNSFDDIREFVLKNVSSGDVVITMGAGDVYKIGEKLLTEHTNAIHVII